MANWSFRALMAGIIVLGFGASAVDAGTEFPSEIKCPVGGEKFKFSSRIAWTEYGKRPDGKVYSNWISPRPLAECPGNKLLIVGEYSSEDIKKLAPLIASAEYLDLRKNESPYYGAAWLMRRLGRDPKIVFAMLQRAAWESDAQPERKKRYQREMVDAAKALADAETPDSMQSWQLYWMMVNGLRELGAFDEATAAMNALPLAKLDVAVPEKVFGEPAMIEESVSPLPGMAPVKRKRENVINTQAIDEAKVRRFLFKGFSAQKVLVAERNTSSEPVTLIPEREALRRCKWYASSLTASETTFCEEPSFAAKVKTYAGPKDSNYN